MNDGNERRGGDHDGDHGDGATERRLDWALREVAGGERAPDVLASVLARHAAGEAGEAADGAATTATSRGRWLAFAAVFLLGVLTVVGVAVLRQPLNADEAGAGDDRNEAATQDPDAPMREVVDAAEIAQLPVDLKAVQLRNLDDDAVAALARRCPNLEHLIVWASTTSRRADDGPTVSITDHAFAAIVVLEKLRKLELHGTLAVRGEGLFTLQSLPLLASLTLRSCDIADEHLQELAKVPSLRELDLGYNHVLGAAGLAAIGDCVGLRRLCLFAIPGQAAANYAPLARLHELEDLDLGGINVVTRSFADEATERRFAGNAAPEPVRGGGVTNACLQDWPRLQKLRLFYATGLTADVGKQLRERYPALRWIDLERCRQIDDTTIAKLIGIESLRHLGIRDCEKVSEHSVPLLALSTQLQSVDFGAAPWMTWPLASRLVGAGKYVQCTGHPDQKLVQQLARAAVRAWEAKQPTEIARTVEQLGNLPDDVVRIECRDLGDSAVPLLEKRSNLVALEFVNDTANDRLTGAGFARVCNRPLLQSLNLMNLPELRGAGLKVIGGLVALESLSFTGIAVDDDTLAQLPELTRLARLSLSSIRSFGAAGTAAIGRCAALRVLDLAKCTQLDAEALVNIGALRQIEELDLSGNPGLRDRAVMSLLECTSLRRLNLAGGAFTSMGLQALTGLRQLEQLNVGHNAELVAAALSHIPAGIEELTIDACPGLGPDAAGLLRGRFAKLRALHVADNAWVTDDVLRVLVELPSLQRLDVSRCAQLTNASFATIRAAKSLRSIDTNGTVCVTKEQAIALQRERPELELTSFVW